MDQQGSDTGGPAGGAGSGANGNASVLAKLADREASALIIAKLSGLAWRRYRIPSIEAEDVAQTAIATYCEVRERYADQVNQQGILVGIFRKKCLEFIDRSVRELRAFRAACRAPDAARVNPRLDPEGHGSVRSPIEQLIKREDVELILEALDELRPEAREMLRLLLVDGVGRKGLLERYAINPNTLDWRLHTYRRELRRILQEKGVLD